jgi:molecular chaperone Hsp33
MNSITHFLFDHLDIRGRFIRLDHEWQHWLSNRHYRSAAEQLLGECVAFISLIAADVKTPGKLTLQLRGEGKVKTLVVQCLIEAEQLKLRGMIDAPTLTESDNTATAFADGDLAFTLHNAITQTDYQSIVPIEGETSSEIFATFLNQSVQHPISLWFSVNNQQITGLLIEKMPNADHMDSDGWNRIQHLANSISPTELGNWSLNQLLEHAFYEETVIVYEPLPIVYFCPDERQRVAELILSLGETECQRILSETGKIIINNDICDKTYVFTAEEVTKLFGHL